MSAVISQKLHIQICVHVTCGSVALAQSFSVGSVMLVLSGYSSLNHRWWLV